MKICLITTTQPAANPRLVKEAGCLAGAGHDVLVLYCYVADWAQEADKEILINAKWKHRQVGGDGKQSDAYKKSRFRFAAYKKINELTGSRRFAEQAHARCYKELLQAAAAHKADWYIGHNPGAMAVAANAAKKTGAKCGFDFEDYHRGEYGDESNAGSRRQAAIENKYISRFAYLTAASPLIKEHILLDFAQLTAPVEIILNTFSTGEQPKMYKESSGKNELKLFWFSQHVGRNRGLEMLLEVLKEINNESITLTLAGNCTEEMKSYLCHLAGDFSKSINFAGVIPPAGLPAFSAKFDIGLALEPAFNINNNIALSNKIFTYLLAGNAIIFSGTDAQKAFNKEYKAGKDFSINNNEELRDCINSYLDSSTLEQQKNHNYNLASVTLNWDSESKKLLQLIN